MSLFDKSKNKVKEKLKSVPPNYTSSWIDYTDDIYPSFFSTERTEPFKTSKPVKGVVVEPNEENTPYIPFKSKLKEILNKDYTKECDCKCLSDCNNLCKGMADDVLKELQKAVDYEYGTESVQLDVDPHTPIIAKDEKDDRWEVQKRKEKEDKVARSGLVWETNGGYKPKLQIKYYTKTEDGNIAELTLNDEIPVNHTPNSVSEDIDVITEKQEIAQSILDQELDRMEAGYQQYLEEEAKLDELIRQNEQAYEQANNSGGQGEHPTI